jgi:DNA (cytosine-5)-methyltransferase 1
MRSGSVFKHPTPVRHMDDSESSSSPGLLPTPVAQPSGNSPEAHLRKKPGRTVVTDLAVMVENGLLASGGKLLPTPVVTDSESSARHTTTTGVAHSGTSLTDAIRLLPTPGAYDGDRGGSQHPDKRRAGNHSVTIQDVAENLTDWGPYAAAVARWEQTLGRPAPPPVRLDGRNGKARLNPEFTEWMMGWPEGWVTDPLIGITRNEQLKATGNGVVPQQAILALTILRHRVGVPIPTYYELVA